jgi:hypothetical protein
MDPNAPYYSRTSRKDCNSSYAEIGIIHTLPTLVDMISNGEGDQTSGTLAQTSIK